MGKERKDTGALSEAPVLGALFYSLTELSQLPSGEVAPGHFAGWEQVGGRETEPTEVGSAAQKATDPLSLCGAPLWGRVRQTPGRGGGGRQGKPINFSSPKSI